MTISPSTLVPAMKKVFAKKRAHGCFDHTSA